MKLVPVETGLRYMTKKVTNNSNNIADKDFKKLSIQVSLSGLSFCVIDVVENTVTLSESVVFESENNPFETLNALKVLLEKHAIIDYNFEEVIVIHRNNLFSLVPNALFNPNELENYLKFNGKILPNDLIAYDEVENFEITNVYIPLVNINNYVYDLFGEFTYKHNGTVMIQSLLNTTVNKETVCYIHVLENQMDVTIVQQKKLQLYNSFNFETKEDFVYYLLFTFEQLQLDTEVVPLKLFGDIEEGDDIYNLCYNYVKNISIFIPSNKHHFHTKSEDKSIDFTLLNAL